MSPAGPRPCRIAVLIAVGLALALVGLGVFLALDGAGNERADGTGPTTGAVPATFAVDLSTGSDDAPSAAVTNPSPTLPLPPVSLPLPGATLPVTTMGVTTLGPGDAVPAGQPPGDLGDDGELDAFAEQCYVGDMAACDELYLAADVGTAYLTYGDTCGGRQPEHTTVPCADLFANAPPTTIG